MNNKVLILGVDGMDPGLTKKYLDAGKMPNVKKFIEAGACREDLVMLGNVPTITPPMWTTLATGATPATHGITDFWGQDLENLDTVIYNMDSRRCQAEQLWNVTAEAGLKTLVWHWPGSAWPPSSESSNLHVVDGAQPVFVNMGTANVDEDKLVYATAQIEKVIYKPNQANDTGAGCIINHLDLDKEAEEFALTSNLTGTQKMVNIQLSIYDGEAGGDFGKMDAVNSPLKPAEGWAIALPEGTKEFTIVTSGGYTRRMAVIWPDADGKYRQAAVYKDKKASEPMCKLEVGKMVTNIMDEVLVEDNKVAANRHFCLLELAEDASKVVLWVGPALDCAEDKMFHPASLYQQIVKNVGLIPPVTTNGVTGKREIFVENFLLESWRAYDKWQADAMKYLIRENNYDVVFSHLHNVDCLGHSFWALAQEGNHEGTDTKKYRGYVEQVYVDTDAYLGEFLPLLDEGWDVIITSDHGLLIRDEEFPPFGDPFGVNAKLMDDMGFTCLKRDSKGNLLKEIDWSHTKAVAARGNHIWINLKGRNAHGIVEPEDKHQVEEEIISALYSYRLETGTRLVSLVLRNQDAALLGMNGPECGDLVYWLTEGPNRPHGDSLSTYRGHLGSSVSPIFIAAGPGIKKDFRTERVIRQVDVAPTVALLAGVRMPAQCEGAPVYQILDKEVSLAE